MFTLFFFVFFLLFQERAAKQLMNKDARDINVIKITGVFANCDCLAMNSHSWVYLPPFGVVLEMEQNSFAGVEA